MRNSLSFTPLLATVKESFDTLESFSLNPNEESNHDNYITWKKVFGQIETVDNSIKNLANLMNSYSY